MAITINGDGLIDIGGTTSTQGRVRLAEDVDNGTNYVELTAPASVASNRVITFPDATTTVVGTDATQTLTNKTISNSTINASQLVAGSVTATQLATAVQPLGVGQTWQNVTASRATGIVYTNTTGRPIMVSIMSSITGTVSSVNWFEVDGVAMTRVGGSGATANMPAYVYAVVPAGATYRLNTVSGVTAPSIWAELS